MLPLALATLLPDIIKKGFDLFDKKFVTEREKEEAQRKFLQDSQDKIQEIWNIEQKNITERHKNDMSSDSWLSKNIRPLTLVYLMGLFTAAFITDVDPEVLQLLQKLLMTVFVFYFGARGLEKIVQLAVPKKNK